MNSTCVCVFILCSIKVNPLFYMLCTIENCPYLITHGPNAVNAAWTDCQSITGHTNKHTLTRRRESMQTKAFCPTGIQCCDFLPTCFKNSVYGEQDSFKTGYCCSALEPPEPQRPRICSISFHFPPLVLSWGCRVSSFISDAHTLLSSGHFHQLLLERS